MRYKRAYYEDESEQLRRIVAGIVMLYVLYLVSSWYFNRAQFWRWLAYGVIVNVTVISAIIGWRHLKYKLHSDKLQKRLDNVRNSDQEETIVNFINRFGMESRSGQGWSFRNYHFDWNRISDLEKVLSERGVKLNLNEGERDVFTLLRFFIQQKEERLTRESVHKEPQRFALLSGSDFEGLLNRLYSAMGYAVEHIGRSGDQGGDLIANKDGERILIQAKCYTDWSVGNAAVQQVVGAMKYYDCQKTQVVTTSTSFTSAAVALGRANHTELISKARLSELLLQYLHESWV